MAEKLFGIQDVVDAIERRKRRNHVTTFAVEELPVVESKEASFELAASTWRTGVLGGLDRIIELVRSANAIPRGAKMWCEVNSEDGVLTLKFTWVEVAIQSNGPLDECEFNPRRPQVDPFYL